MTLSTTKSADDTCESCNSACRKRYQEREALIQSARDQIRASRESMEGDGWGARFERLFFKEEVDKAEQAAARFERNNKAIIRAYAADNVYNQGKEGHCLTNLSKSKEKFEKLLGLAAAKFTNEDFSNPETGFKAALYRSESDGRVILAFQGTDPETLVDWDTNIKNGLGRSTAQGEAARKLAKKLTDAGVDFDIAGHSKGGGLATLAATRAPKAQVYTFNSAGVSPGIIKQYGEVTVENLTRRTQAFRFQDEFLTIMQSQTTAQGRIDQAEQLLSELKGEAGWKNPLKIIKRDTSGKNEANFVKERDDLFTKFSDEIKNARQRMAAGDNLDDYFPPAIGTPVDLGPAPDTVLNQRLDRLNNHTMRGLLDGGVLPRMESQKNEDIVALHEFVSPSDNLRY